MARASPWADRYHQRVLRALARHCKQSPSEEVRTVSVAAFAIIFGFNLPRLHAVPSYMRACNLNVWTPRSSDQKALTAYLSRILLVASPSENGPESEVLWPSVEAVFSMIARREGEIDFSDKDLLHCLDWATKMPVPDNHDFSSPQDPLLRLHSATLHLIRILVKAQSSNAHVRKLMTQCIPFMTHSTLRSLRSEQEQRILEHDKIYTDILAYLSFIRGTTWLDDAANVIFVRVWAWVIAQWTETSSYGRLRSSKAAALSTRRLLFYTKFRQPAEQDWGDDRALVQEIAVEVATEWMLLDVIPRMANSEEGPPANDNLCIAYTAEVIDALDVRTTSEAVRCNVEALHESLANKSKPKSTARAVKAMVQPLLNVLLKKLLEYRQLEHLRSLSPSQIPLPPSPTTTALIIEEVEDTP
ncbi:hypothetical protein EIP91_010197 [Steccherinum ochraceum]|nr:hypothetical protein EIP91_010197 [Steccherinum ochraceum]